MKAMMLTAGLGTRLRPVTNFYAKPAVPFMGIPLLYYPLLLMEQAGVESLVLNTHYKPEQIARLAQSLEQRSSLKVHLSHEPGAPLGSGGGIWKARPHLIGGDFLVSNGDEVILPREAGSIRRFVDEHLRHRALATILTMRHPLVGTQFGGVWADANGNVLGFGKDKSKYGGEGYHYIGLLLLNERIFEYLPEGESNILYDALMAAIAKGETVRTMVSDFTWFETGNPTDFLHGTGEALALLESGQGEDAKALREIVHRFWPAGTKLERTSNALVLKAPDARIEPGAELNGFVVVEREAVIRSGAIVEDSVILPQARVQAQQSIKQQMVLPPESAELVL